MLCFRIYGSAGRSGQRRPPPTRNACRSTLGARLRSTASVGLVGERQRLVGNGHAVRRTTTPLQTQLLQIRRGSPRACCRRRILPPSPSCITWWFAHHTNSFSSTGLEAPSTTAEPLPLIQYCFRTYGGARSGETDWIRRAQHVQGAILWSLWGIVPAGVQGSAAADGFCGRCGG